MEQRVKLNNLEAEEQKSFDMNLTPRSAIDGLGKTGNINEADIQEAVKHVPIATLNLNTIP